LRASAESSQINREMADMWYELSLPD